VSESNQVLVRYVAEGVYGTTPTNSSFWLRFPYTSESIGGEQDKRPSNIVTANRVIPGMTELRRSVGGSLESELRYGWFDDLILAAFCGDQWDADVVTLGTTDYSFSIEKEFADLASGKSFSLSDGMVVDGMELNMSHGDFVTVSFDFLGSDEELSATSAVGTGTETEPSATSKSIAAALGFGSFSIDGSPNSAQIMSATFRIGNNNEPRWALGKLGASEQDKGYGSVSGTLNCYLDVASMALIDAGRANTNTRIQFTVSDEDGNSYAIDIPKARLSSRTPVSQGVNQRVMAELEYMAVIDETTITRSDA